MIYIIPYNNRKKEHFMPANPNFKSVSVSKETHKQLESLAKSHFEVPVSIQTLIDFLLKQKLKGKRNGRSR